MKTFEIYNPTKTKHSFETAKNYSEAVTKFTNKISSLGYEVEKAIDKADENYKVFTITFSDGTQMILTVKKKESPKPISDLTFADIDWNKDPFEIKA